MKSKASTDLGLFLLLVSFGVLGRWFQPTWFFTPTAACALFAGYYLSDRRLALLVPLCIMGITDLVLPGYQTWAVMAAVYATLATPVVLGRVLRRAPSYGRLAACGLLPAVIFYVTSNFAVWASTGMYEHTLGGLVSCYVAAIPFFRVMITGDVLYTALLFGAYVAATSRGFLPSRQRQKQPVPVRKED